MQFICPVCKGKLTRENNSLICENRHCFDFAKSGYVNFLLGSKGGNHGDNKLMATARREFLKKGYYQPLCDALVSTVKEYAFSGARVIDCGCGEGYYTNSICAQLPEIELCAFDISKDAVSLAARENRACEYAVASSFDIPIADASTDILLEVFSPFCRDEFSRILKKGGILISVIPLENHLFELKQAVYDKPYKNEPAPLELDGFELISAREVRYEFDLSDNSDIKNLFMMTPYYYKTGVKEQARLNTLQSLRISAEFLIIQYKKCD